MMASAATAAMIAFGDLSSGALPLVQTSGNREAS
jgi:hypothetical protein